MKLRLKEDPKEWRKAALLGALGLTLLSSLFCWRRLLPVGGLMAVLSVLACVALAALMRPRWFRGYYRLGSRVGFYLTRFAGYAALTRLFLFILVPMGLIMRLCGQDLLWFKRKSTTDSYWVASQPLSPLDRMF